MALATLLATAMHGITDHALYALKGGYKSLALAGDVTLDDTYPAVVGLDPDGSARTVVLDGAAAADAAVDGLFRVIVNRADAAEALTVNDADANTIGTISQNEMAIFFHDSDEAIGWQLVGIVTIALS